MTYPYAPFASRCEKCGRILEDPDPPRCEKCRNRYCGNCCLNMTVAAGIRGVPASFPPVLYSVEKRGAW